jgi:fructose 1,6-bisphosphatase
MPIMQSHARTTTHDGPDIFDAARRRAEELRLEARDRIFDAAADRARQALRPAERFAASLARHARLRAHRVA